MKNIEVLIDGNVTMIEESKLEYFQDVLGAELVDYAGFEEVDEEKEQPKNKSKKNKKK